MSNFDELLELMTLYGYEFAFDYEHELIIEKGMMYLDKVIWFKEGKFSYRINHNIIKSLSRKELEHLLQQIEDYENGKDFFLPIIRAGG